MPRLNSENKPTSRSLAKVVGDTSIGLVGWAVLCAVLFGLRFGRLWNIVGRTWQGMVYAYLAFYVGSIIVILCFTNLERIQSERLRFAAQMLMCLVLALAACGVLVVLTL